MSEELSLCATCKCKKENCKKLKITKKKNCTIIKCLNYEKDNTKLHHYEDFNYKIKSR